MLITNRFQCDKRRDSCGQCLRAKITCPGYHDPKSILFRHETEAVTQKFLKQEKPAIPPKIVISVEERAKQMFLSQYVFGTSPLLGYMQTFYPAGLGDVHLAESVKAVYLAFFSTEVVSPSTLQVARKTYGHALSLTNKALQSSESATKDTMLLTVLLLDLFECLANNGQNSSIEFEMKHIDGALALVRLRGHEQFRGSIGLRMFLQLSRNVFIRCLHREVEVPSELMALRSVAAQFVDTRDPKWRFSNAMIEYARLRGALRIREWSDDENIRFAREIDNYLVDIYTSVTPDRESQPANTNDPLCKMRGNGIHLDSSHNIHKTWNSLWLVRILLHDAILECNQRQLLNETRQSILITEQIEASTKTILSLSSEICSSVSKYMNSSNAPPHRAVAHTLIFPLYVAASSSVCPHDMRKWIIGRLAEIGSNLAIPQAVVAKEKIERREGGNPWNIVAMLRGLHLSDFAWTGFPSGG